MSDKSDSARINLSLISYRHRAAGAALLVSRANVLSGLGVVTLADEKSLIGAVAYYDMALALLKPFDPNYSTIVNWKCLALLSLGQYEDALVWYREIVRISDQADGKATRSAAAALAEQRIVELQGRSNKELEIVEPDATNFDVPAYCMFAEEFCLLLAEWRFRKAHTYLSPTLKKSLPVAKLRKEWRGLVGSAGRASTMIVLQQHMVEWPDRRTKDVGWCYFTVSEGEVNEAVEVVVGRGALGEDCITRIEFGRP